MGLLNVNDIVTTKFFTIQDLTLAVKMSEDDGGKFYHAAKDLLDKANALILSERDINFFDRDYREKLPKRVDFIEESYFKKILMNDLKRSVDTCTDDNHRVLFGLLYNFDMSELLKATCPNLSYQCYDENYTLMLSRVTFYLRFNEYD